MSDPTRTHVPGPDPDLTRTAAPGAGPEAAEGPPPPVPGYELLAEVGRGGMGVVYRARDESLARDVAVKLLQERYAPGSASARRFVEEARITGRLAHPGIPAVHQVGTLADGRPFLAMKLIGGRTLDALLKERTDPAADRGRFVAVFEQVAQAVGYAHSLGVIHRDLKPANVMVGAFAEVQVMDWGLSKEMRNAERGTRNPEGMRIGEFGAGGSDPNETADLSSIPPSPFPLPPSTETRAGAILGTPAYMPPEQATGDTDRTDARSDVFGLGAVLCVILTGEPPFVGADARTTWQLAARADLTAAFARLGACGAAPDLIALAKRCLAADPADRPADGGEVAAAVAASRADAEQRAKNAEMDRARAEVKTAEERKRRRVVLALATALLALFAGGGVAAWWAENVRSERRAAQLTHDAEREARRLATERDILTELHEVRVQRERGWEAADDPGRWAYHLEIARAECDRAESLLADGEPTADLRDRVAAARAGIDQDERDRALLAELDRVSDENDIRYLIPVSFDRGPADRYAAAFRDYGIDLERVPTDEAIAWLKGHRFRDRLTTAVRNWQLTEKGFPFGPKLTNAIREQIIRTHAPAIAAVGGQLVVESFRPQPTTGQRLAAILRRVTDDPFAREWWAAIDHKDTAKLKELLARPELSELSSRELSSLADGLAGDLGSPTRELLGDLLRIAYDRFPGDYWVNFRLGIVADTRYAPAVSRHFAAAVAARPNSAIARVVLGMTLDKLALHQGKEKDPTGLQMIRRAAEVDPDSAWPHVMLGMIAAGKNDWPAALAAYRDAVRADPDTAFVMISPLWQMSRMSVGKRTVPSEQEFERFFTDLIAIHPEHFGAYLARAGFHADRRDSRAALADYRAAKERMPADHPRRVVVDMELRKLERLAAWEAKLPAVLGGELKPASGAEFSDLAEYCAGFERKYALAARFAGEALAADPNTAVDPFRVIRFAGWAVQAAAGNGADAESLTPTDRTRLRRRALEWLRDAIKRPRPVPPHLLAPILERNSDLAPVRDPKEVAKLPADERAEWTRFWAELPKPSAPGSGKPMVVTSGPERERAPPHRPVKR